MELILYGINFNYNSKKMFIANNILFKFPIS